MPIFAAIVGFPGGFYFLRHSYPAIVSLVLTRPTGLHTTHELGEGLYMGVVPRLITNVQQNREQSLHVYLSVVINYTLNFPIHACLIEILFYGSQNFSFNDLSQK